MSKTKFPITVKRGNVSVKIYHTPTRGFDSYTVAYYFGGQRQRRTFADLSEARQEAEIAANKMCAGELDVLTLTNADRAAYVRSVGMLQPLGTPLEMAVMQFVEAEKILQGRSLVEAAKYYAKHHSKGVVPRRVPEVVAELLAAKTAEGHSEHHLRSLRSRLKALGAVFPAPISLVLASELQDYLRDLKSSPSNNRRDAVRRGLSAVSKNNVRKAIQNLFHFAQARGYLPKGLTEADEVKPYKTPPSAIGVFTPDEMTKLLQHAEPALVPFLAIGAFAGLRHAEILRLDWQEVDLTDGHIEVKAQKAKTASRRLVPVPANLKQWLLLYHQGTGKVVAQQSVNHLLKELSQAAQVKWKHNGLRHSYISYRVAQIQNVAQVALEAGNSPKIIFSNYRELVRPAAAKKWFGIEPDTSNKVTVMPKGEEAAVAVA